MKMKQWSMAGDPCPACGSDQTIGVAFSNLAAILVMAGLPPAMAGPPTYTMICFDCRKREPRAGFPWQQEVGSGEPASL